MQHIAVILIIIFRSNLLITKGVVHSMCIRYNDGAPSTECSAH